MSHTRLNAPIAAIVIAAAVAGCGSSATTTTGTTPQSTATSTTSTTTSAPARKRAKQRHKKSTPAKTTTTPALTTTTTTTPAPTTPAAGTTTTSAKPVYARPIQATLVADNHAPTVNKPWHYTVTVTDANGLKLSGTETTHYTFGGVVVGTEKPTNVRFTNGVYHDTITFPAAAVGHPLAVQVVIQTAIGSKTLSWAIKVKP